MLQKNNAKLTRLKQTANKNSPSIISNRQNIHKLTKKSHADQTKVEANDKNNNRTNLNTNHARHV